MTVTIPRPKRRNDEWVASSNPFILYRARVPADRLLPRNRFATPHIQSRPRRPHAIHIISYPSGYVPPDLRPESPQARRKRENKAKKASTAGKATDASQKALQLGDLRSKPLLGKFLTPFSAQGQNPATATRPPPSKASIVASAFRRLSLYRIDETIDEPMSRTSTMAATMRPPVLAPQGSQRNSIMSMRSVKGAVTSHIVEVPKPVASGSGVTCSIILAESNVFLSGFEHDSATRNEGSGTTALLRGKLRVEVTKNVKLKAVQMKLVGKARTEWPEGIPPAKVNQFEEESLRTQVLTFFNATNDNWETEYGNQCSYTLKTASANTSSVNLAAPFNRNSSASSIASPLSIPGNRNSMTTLELRRLSMQSIQSRSFSKGEVPSPLGSGTQVKGYKVFYPGTYEYSFELPLDHHQLETTKLPYGSVKWELQATIDRAGAFKPNLNGTKEISVVRVPDQMSLEMSEPISISRRWEDQLHYDIIISGKSFPIGSRIPIAFKLTPLAKVQVHKLKVFVTESVEYWTNDRKVTRKDPGRKILLLEKTAGKPLDPIWASSNLRVTSGGELTSQERQDARHAATTRRNFEASRSGTTPQPLPEPVDNLLGDLDLGLECFWAATEIEANVQIPTCEMMAKNRELRLNPDCSWKNVNVFHWIKIVLRISRADPDDPTGTKRRHFEISIDSPFTVLNCRATQANTSLPQYCGFEMTPGESRHMTCGCPDSAGVAYHRTNSPNSSSGSLANLEPTASDGFPAAPQAAHLAPAAVASPTGTATPPPQSQTDALGIVESRPIHLLRAPSYNPPAFDADEPPPQLDAEPAVGPVAAELMTPPPNYDAIIGTPSVDGLADYFTRLANYGYNADDDSDSDDGPLRLLERSGRVNVRNPRTPGGRGPSRSLEISRPIVNLSLNSLPNAVLGSSAGTAL